MPMLKTWPMGRAADPREVAGEGAHQLNRQKWVDSRSRGRFPLQTEKGWKLPSDKEKGFDMGEMDMRLTRETKGFFGRFKASSSWV